MLEYLICADELWAYICDYIRVFNHAEEGLSVYLGNDLVEIRHCRGVHSKHHVFFVKTGYSDESVIIRYAVLI